MTLGIRDVRDVRFMGLRSLASWRPRAEEREVYRKYLTVYLYSYSYLVL